jgi:hypothetical protein
MKLLCLSLGRSGFWFDEIGRLSGSTALYFFCHGCMQACQVSINFHGIILEYDFSGKVLDFSEVEHALSPVQGRYLIACGNRTEEYGIVWRTILREQYLFARCKRLRFIRCISSTSQNRTNSSPIPYEFS